MSGKTKTPKGAMHFDGRKSIGSLEANENQRRWDMEHYKTVNKKPRHWYDPTRDHLNFEISKGGQINKSGTSEPVDVRWRKRLEELGVTPNPLVNERQNRKKVNEDELNKMPNQLVEFIFSGDHKTLNRMAFGDQVVDFATDYTADNSGLIRQNGIEDWALDIYKWLCKKYGEENIVGFDVHLDENTAHIHASIIPVVLRTDKKTGEQSEVVSYKGIFGKDKATGHDIMERLHTELYEQVNCKYGLMRGDSVQLTGARHKNKIEMFYVLNDAIEELDERIDDLAATIKDLEHQRSTIEKEIRKANEDLKQKKITQDEHKNIVQSLELRKANLDDKIESRRESLMKYEDDMATMRKQVSNIKAEYKMAIAQQDKLTAAINHNTYNIAKGAVFDDLMNGFYKLFSMTGNPEPEVIDKIGNPLLSDFFEGSLSEVMKDAGGFMLAYIQGATTVAPSSGGGGGGNNDLPKKKDDEDWWKYGRNVVGHAHRSKKAKTAKSSYHR